MYRGFLFLQPTQADNYFKFQMVIIDFLKVVLLVPIYRENSHANIIIILDVKYLHARFIPIKKSFVIAGELTTFY
jgi:hypothetical protein